MSQTARVAVAFAVVCLLAASAVAAPKSACKVAAYPAYDAKIKEFTTEKFFLTELVDHLPLSSCVPAPDAFLKHIVGAPDVLTYVKDINAYMRLLESKSPRVKVFSIGKSEEGRDIIVMAVADEATIGEGRHGLAPTRDAHPDRAAARRVERGVDGDRDRALQDRIPDRGRAVEHVQPLLPDRGAGTWSPPFRCSGEPI